MERCDLGRFAWAGTVASFAATVGIVSAFLLAQSDPPCTSCNPASRACFRPFNSPLLHTAPLMTYPSSQAGEHAEHALATCIASMARSLAMVVRNSPNEGKFKTEAVELVEVRRRMILNGISICRAARKRRDRYSLIYTCVFPFRKSNKRFKYPSSRMTRPLTSTMTRRCYPIPQRLLTKQKMATTSLTSSREACTG